MEENSILEKRFLCINPFGVLFSDSVLIFDKDKTYSVKLNTIKKVFIKKERSFYGNFFFGLVAALLLFNRFLLNYFEINLVMTLTSSLALLIIAFVVKKTNYKFFIITQNHDVDVIKLDVDKYKIGHSKKILKSIQKVLKNNVN